MGALIGLGVGLGLLLVGWTVVDPAWRPRVRTRRRSRLESLLLRAGLADVRRSSVVGTCAVCFAMGAFVMLGVSGVPAIGIVFGLMAGAAPIAVLRARAARRIREHSELWPDAVDNLASAVRAGLSLPEALIQLGERGPAALRDPFVRFARDYQSTGSFSDSLDLLKHRLADATGDRVVEALRIAREVGGGDLGRMMRQLSSFLRDDLRTRQELESRQSWTVNGARLAVAAPWLVLLSLSAQEDAIQRYATPAGAFVLGVGSVACVVAYRLMLHLGRLPAERRVMAS
ncbi:type II secretion system protein F [Aeromicrobium sp. Root495]|uniref:type II secretion system F family protein n=1 Tax=Aeromicrobium sp. Root495 TaxID=1736550 RepID=UPI0006F91A19|nr:type II secretion system F family protein [Aeromicrobium sp. Root495]KQY58596.1 type II secretion system protein F [Aeromicrobium sp. Root495]